MKLTIDPAALSAADWEAIEQIRGRSLGRELFVDKVASPATLRALFLHEYRKTRGHRNATELPHVNSVELVTT